MPWPNLPIGEHATATLVAMERANLERVFGAVLN